MEVAVVASRRGFFAEMQHQAQLAEHRENQRQLAEAATVRRVEIERRKEARRVAAAQRASVAKRKQLEREATAADVLAKKAEVDELNNALDITYACLDNLLATTLDVDDFVELTTLRRSVEHPPFDRPELEMPTPAPARLTDPAEPVLRQLESPKGLFGRKKKLEDAQARAEAELIEAQRAWRDDLALLSVKRAQLAADHAAAEQVRALELAQERARYARESQERESEVSKHNAMVDTLIADLGYGAVDAVQKYVGVVLANSDYPEGFEVKHEAEFEPSSAELRVKVLIPGPGQIPTVKAYRYTRASDKISHLSLAQKDIKARYANIVHQVALRTLHEVFEADRRNIVQSISLEVGTETICSATGKDIYVPFVAVGTLRDSFTDINLSAIVPSVTLHHLGAAVSQNPLDLVPANTTGIRRS